jgi:hypothetical protein
MVRRRRGGALPRARETGVQLGLRLSEAVRERGPQLVTALDAAAQRLSQVAERAGPPATPRPTVPSAEETAARRLEQRVFAVERALDDLAAELRRPVDEARAFETAMGSLLPRLKGAADRASSEFQMVLALAQSTPPHAFPSVPVTEERTVVLPPPGVANGGSPVPAAPPVPALPPGVALDDPQNIAEQAPVPGRLGIRGRMRRRRARRAKQES